MPSRRPTVLGPVPAPSKEESPALDGSAQADFGASDERDRTEIDSEMADKARAIDERVDDSWEDKTVAEKAPDMSREFDESCDTEEKTNDQVGAADTATTGRRAAPPGSVQSDTADKSFADAEQRNSSSSTTNPGTLVDDSRPGQDPFDEGARPLPPLSVLQGGVGAASAPEPAPLVDPGPAAVLTVIAGNDRGKSFDVGKAKITVGRATENDVVLTDIAVSRRHLAIEHDGRRFVMHDIGSGNGTLVNSRPQALIPLASGDRLELGNTLFRFDISTPAAAALGGDSASRSSRDTEADQQQGLRALPLRSPPTLTGPNVDPAHAASSGAMGPSLDATALAARPQRAATPTLAAFSRRRTAVTAALREWFRDRRKRVAAIAVVGLVAVVLIAVALRGGGQATEPRSSIVAEPELRAAAGAPATADTAAAPEPEAAEVPAAAQAPTDDAADDDDDGDDGDDGDDDDLTREDPPPAIAPLPEEEPAPDEQTAPQAAPEQEAESTDQGVAAPAADKDKPASQTDDAPKRPARVRRQALAKKKKSAKTPRRLKKQGKKARLRGPVRASPAAVKKRPRPLRKPMRSASAIGKAEGLYRSRQFSDAAELLRAAAEQASSNDAAAMERLAGSYAAVGKQLSEGDAVKRTNAPRAMAAYRKALRVDRASGRGVHGTYIRLRLREVAPRSAAAFMAQKRYEAAKGAADEAVNYGAGANPMVTRVRAALSRKAGEIYRSGVAMRPRDAKAAAVNFKRVLRMVPKDNPLYAKARAALAQP